ncbi:MAG: branched-chain amino acid ABC transporter permease [Candidatus Firestonebacteria bacterium]|nr:branched-chain amino acid ABC transporter permease [Candidatus Firestonebacteria bacterium]
MFIQQIVNGLTVGGIYALIAIGYTMVYGIIELINFAHGEIYMLGAFFTLVLIKNFNIPWILAVIVSMLFCSLLGIVIDYIAYRPLRKSPRLTVLITAIGMSLFLQNMSLLLWGGRTQHFPEEALPLFFSISAINIGEINISWLQIIIIFVTFLIMLGLHFLVTKTKLGKAMRATAQDSTTASLMGINPDHIISYTFALGSCLGGLSGIMVGLYYNAIFPTMGYTAGIKAFSAAVLGGIGNLPGAMLGGVLLGVAEVLGAGYISSSYRNGIAYAVMIIVIVFRPSGLLGRKLVKKV